MDCTQPHTHCQKASGSNALGATLVVPVGLQKVQGIHPYGG